MLRFIKGDTGAIKIWEIIFIVTFNVIGLRCSGPGGGGYFKLYTIFYSSEIIFPVLVKITKKINCLISTQSWLCTCTFKR